MVCGTRDEVCVGCTCEVRRFRARLPSLDRTRRHQSFGGYAAPPGSYWP